MSTEIINSIVVDTGALLELLAKSSMGQKFKEQILEKRTSTDIFISPLTVTELLYILGRLEGFEEGKHIVQEFVEPFIIYEEKILREKAAKLKMEFGIAIADCYVIALGQLKNIPIYMKREREINKILKDRSIPADLQFIDDLE
ncbi:MAG: PIN domain-containing protein [Promethearchaeota archaeon]